MAYKIVERTLKTTYAELKNIFDENKDVYAITIKNTDIIIVGQDEPDMFAYSRKAEFHGNNSRIDKINKLLHDAEFRNHYGIYDLSDWRHIVAIANKTKFTARSILSKVELRKMLKEGYVRKIQKYPEYGVELEIESESSLDRVAIQNTNETLIHDVGSDGSVYGGTEIRFNHPTLNKWKLQDISLVLNKCKELGAFTDKGTAGMHIHISRNNIKKIIKNFADNLPVMKDILYPINCRKLKKYDGNSMYYGVEGNIYHDQSSEFGTLEIRAWNSTLDPKLFLARIKFCKTLTNWLETATVFSVESFFNFMSKSEKDNYKYMLNHKENPHEWGFPAKAINALLA